MAAGPGQVVVAGKDQTTIYGPTANFYGNLVVVQLDQTYQGQPVFTLYGHLKAVLVKPGQHVNLGEVVGQVGATGVAIGPHLHFEVRVGENTYPAARNPELWLKPLRYNGLYQGAVAGRVVDKRGQLVQGYPVVIRPIRVDADTPRSRYLTTYTTDAFSLAGDARLQENFATTDLPLGSYTVSVNTTRSYQQVINVTSGSLTWVTFVVEPPPLLPITTTTATRTP
jgi:murein DD-endopeptidase MepM/ murein hydrolase activator NlpD